MLRTGTNTRSTFYASYFCRFPSKNSHHHPDNEMHIQISLKLVITGVCLERSWDPNQKIGCGYDNLATLRTDHLPSPPAQSRSFSWTRRGGWLCGNPLRSTLHISLPEECVKTYSNGAEEGKDYLVKRELRRSSWSVYCGVRKRAERTAMWLPETVVEPRAGSGGATWPVSPTTSSS